MAQWIKSDGSDDNVVAFAHTHGNYKEGSFMMFSLGQGSDTGNAQEAGVFSYVALPNGTVYKYIPTSSRNPKDIGNIQRISNDAPSDPTMTGDRRVNTINALLMKSDKYITEDEYKSSFYK